MKTVSKVAKVVGVVAGVAAAAVTGGASLGVSAALLSSISVGAGVIGSLAGSLAKAKPIERSVVGSITDFRYNPDAGIPIAIGRTYFAGIPVHRDGYPNGAEPTPNPYLTYAIEFSGAGPIGGLESWQVDREPVTFSGGGANGQFAGYMWLDWQDGLVNEPTALSPPFAGMEGWDANSRASGHAMALWTLKYDAQDREGRLYQQGEPEPGAVLNGVLCYDPRKDSTYPGGSGSHRWADPGDTAAHDAARATWEVSDDPFINALNHALGTWHRDMDDPASQYVKVRGAGEPIGAIDVAAFVEGANVCQANGWTLGGVYSTLDPKWGVLKAMLACGGGEPIMAGGLLSCLVETPRVSLATVTEDQIVGQTRPPGMNPRRGRPNSYIPRYTSEAHGWEMIPAPPVTIDAYVTADGGLKQEGLPFLFGQDAKQAQQLAYYKLADDRELPISTMLMPRWVGYKPGDCVTLAWPTIGYASQKAIVQERRFDPLRMRVGMDLKTETDDKHAAALALDPVPPAAPSLSSEDFRSIPQPPIGDWTVTGETLESDDGAIPIIRIEGGVTNTNIAFIVFEYRPLGSLNWRMGGVFDASATDHEINEVTPGTDYEVSVAYISRSGVVSTRRMYGPVTAGSMSIPYSGLTDRPAPFTSYPTKTTWTQDGDKLAEDASDLTDPIANGAVTLTGNLPRAGPKQLVQVYPGMSIRITARVAPGADHSHAQIVARSLLADGTSAGGASITTIVKTGDGFDEYVAGFTTEASYTGPDGVFYRQITDPAASKLIRFQAGGRNGGASAEAQVSSLGWEDVTQALANRAALQSAIDDAQADADAAQADADEALGVLGFIASDGQLKSFEKVRAQREYNDVIAEQAGLGAEGTAYGVTAEKDAYDAAITALKSYLRDTVGVLDASYVWTDITGNTAVTRSTWNSNWSAVYAARQTLLNAILESAKTRSDGAQAAADSAQADADAAQADADAALADLFGYSDDGYLKPHEKAASKREYHDLTNEQAANEALADDYSITTEKTAYGNAITALKSYLRDTVAVLNASYVWIDTAGPPTAIARATWDGTWSAVYTARQTLLNKIADEAGKRAELANVTGAGTLAGLNAINWGGPEMLELPGNFNNLVVYQDYNIADHWSGGVVPVSAGTSDSQPWPWYLRGTGDFASYQDGWIYVEPGETLFFGCWISTLSSTSGARMGLHLQKSDGTQTFVYADDNPIPPSTSIAASGGPYLGTVTVPPGYYRARPFVWSQSPHNGPVDFTEFRVSRFELSADVTATNQVAIGGPTTLTVERDYTGTPKSAQFNLSKQFFLKRGDADVSSAASWAVSSHTGITRSIDGDGTLTISAMTAAAAASLLSITATYGGKDYVIQCQIVFKDDAPPSGGGTNTDTSGLASPTSTSWTTISAIMAVEALDSDNRVNAAINYSYWGGYMQLRVRRSVNSNMSAATVIATGAAGTDGAPGLPPFEPGDPGSAVVSVTDGGRTAFQTYYYDIQGILETGSGAKTIESGSATVTTA